MRLNLIPTFAAALIGSASVADATSYTDPETGFTFSSNVVQYALGKSLTYRIAVPSPVTSGATYDAVVQVVAPLEVGWAGLSWGGSMTYSPLSVGWANGNSAIVSSRYATSHTTPQAYPGASYQVLKVGTRANGTFWQYTAKCTGCTSFIGSNNKSVYLAPTGTNRFAWAYSSSKPSNAGSNATVINVHDVYNYITPNFAEGQNPNFAALVTKNS